MFRAVSARNVTQMSFHSWPLLLSKQIKNHIPTIGLTNFNSNIRPTQNFLSSLLTNENRFKSPSSTARYQGRSHQVTGASRRGGRVDKASRLKYVFITIRKVNFWPAVNKRKLKKKKERNTTQVCLRLREVGEEPSCVRFWPSLPEEMRVWWESCEAPERVSGKRCRDTCC